MIEDWRQILLRLPMRVVWLRKAREAVSRTKLGVLRVAKTPLRLWDGFLNGEPVAGGYSLDEAVAKLEVFAQWRTGEVAA